MKQQLTIEHIYPFFLFDLKMKSNDENYNYSGVKVEPNIVELDSISKRGYVAFDGIPGFYPVEHFKPILHPFSDITKPITVEGYNEGKEFVPIIALAQLNGAYEDEHDVKRLYTKVTNSYELFYNTASHIDDCVLSIQDGFIDTLNYEIVLQLYEWHFDIHGLIEYGLAIDINTLNK